MILTLLRGIAPQLITGALVALLAGGGFVYFKHKYYQEGYNHAIDDIAAQNKEAITRAGTARERVRACYGDGGVWDQVARLCVRGDVQPVSPG